MSKEQNLDTTQKLGEAVSTGNLQALKDIFANNVVDHDAPGQGTGPEGFIKFFPMMPTAFPDLKVAVDHIVQDDMAMAYKIRGKHKGDFLGIGQPASSSRFAACRSAVTRTARSFNAGAHRTNLVWSNSLVPRSTTARGSLRRLLKSRRASALNRYEQLALKPLVGAKVSISCRRMTTRR